MNLPFLSAVVTAPPIRHFLGVVTLNEGDRKQAMAVYEPSQIDRLYMLFPHNAEAGTGLKPCGKTRLRPDMDYKDEQGDTHHGVVLVPDDKANAILDGCSMQKDRLLDYMAAAQRREYERGHAALEKLTAG